MGSTSWAEKETWQNRMLQEHYSIISNSTVDWCSTCSQLFIVTVDFVWLHQFNIWVRSTYLRITAALQLCLWEKSAFSQPHLFILLVYENEKVFELLNQKRWRISSSAVYPPSPASWDISAMLCVAVGDSTLLKQNCNSHKAPVLPSGCYSN